MTEALLLTGALEPTNEAYAIAKIAALKLAHSYVLQYGMDIRALMPTNLYGPGDRYDAMYGHVIPALLLRMQQTQADGHNEFVVWGSGTVRREFLYVDDLASAMVQVLSLPKALYQADWQDKSRPLLTEFFYNVGSDAEVTIGELVQQIGKVASFQGEIRFDRTKPDGTPRKKLDCTRLYALCPWRPKTSLIDGLSKTWQDDFVDVGGKN
jgi:GDP-L-fucose synthase